CIFALGCGGICAGRCGASSSAQQAWFESFSTGDRRFKPIGSKRSHLTAVADCRHCNRNGSKLMDMLALAVAVLSLIISVAAYCRSGAKQNISAIAQRAADEVTANIKAGYQRSRRVIADLQSRLA